MQSRPTRINIRVSEKLDEHTYDCLRAFRSCLLCCRPREVTPMWNVPFFVFTDASFSPDDKAWPCGLGGVMCQEQVTAELQHCAEALPHKLIEADSLPKVKQPAWATHCVSYSIVLPRTLWRPPPAPD